MLQAIPIPEIIIGKKIKPLEKPLLLNVTIKINVDKIMKMKTFLFMRKFLACKMKRQRPNKIPINVNIISLKKVALIKKNIIAK